MAILINNRYEICEQLGRGGMGVVYLVKDTLWDNRKLALKTLAVRGYTAEDIQIFKQEFKTMVGLRHPNLVRVFDFGKISFSDDKDLEGDYFFTMEYVQGENFYDATEQAGYDMVVGMTIQICCVLQYIHRNGLIHFDVKPENIMIVETALEDGTIQRVAKLMDLGLARRSAANQTVQGTVEYMAPELIRGEKVDGRADIYSLGVTLYQVLTRCLPFEGSSELEIVKKHLQEIPPPIDMIARDVPVGLSQAIERMLAKNPEERFSNVTEVMQALQPFVKKTTVIMPEEEQVTYSIVGKFIGREHELARLRKRLNHLLNRAIDSQPNFFSIGGEAGMGKTRFMQEFKSDAQLEGVPFFESRCYPHTVRPYEPFVVVLRQAVREARNHKKQGEHLLKKYGSELQRLLPDLEVDGIEQPSLFLDPQQAKLRLEDSVTQFLLELAGLQPYIIYFDDFHFADELTIDLLKYLLRNARNHPLLICENHKVSDEYEQFLRLVLLEGGEENVEEITLEEFKEKDIREFVMSALGLEVVPDELVHWMHKEVGGSLFLITEFIRSLARHIKVGECYNAQVQVPLAEIKKISLPKSITELFQQRLDSLDTDSLKVLEILSAFDAPVPFQLLKQFPEFSEAEFLDSLRTLQRMRIIDFIEREGIYSFSQSKVRELVYANIPEKRKQELHKMIGELEEQFYAHHLVEHAEEIASHFEKGGDTEKAFIYYFKAAKVAASVYAGKKARSLYEKALELVSPAEQAAKREIMEKLGQTYMLTGDYEKAIDIYHQLLSVPLATPQKVDVLKELATVLERRGDFEEAIHYLHLALDSAEEMREKVEILNELAVIYIRRGMYDEADRICLQALEMTQSEVVLDERADAFNNLGIIHINRNETEHAEECFRMSLEAREQTGNRLRLALSYTNLGIIANRRADYDNAIYFSQKALQLSEEVGDIRHVARSYNNLGIIAYDRAEYEESLNYYQKALDIFIRTGDKAGSSWSWYNVGELQFKLCEYEQSLRSLERSLQLYRQLYDMQGLAEVYDQLGKLYFVLGKMREAMDYAQQAQRVIQTSQIKTETGNNLLLFADLHITNSEWEKAEAAILEAITFYQEIGDVTNHCYATMKLGEMYYRKRDHQKAEMYLNEAYARRPKNVLLQAEILLHLGTLSQQLHDRKSVVHLQDAYSLSEQATVSEISWKICFALFREYQSRGLPTKAFEYGEKTLVILKFILSKFTQPDLAEAYLHSHNRSGVINFINQMGELSREA